ncbi:MAG: hypothetical protein Q8Q92_04925 [bacterium]|nr:hypothetical protein [bacterium]
MTILIALGAVTPAHAQFGAIKKGLEKIKSIRITIKDSTGNKDADAKMPDSDAKTAGTTDEAAANEKPAVAQESKPKKLKDGETAMIHTALPENDATAKVKAYFNSKDVDYTINPDTGRITTDWFGERRCGPGFYRCANRATVRVVAEEGKTVIRIQVMERKREGGINEKSWKDGTTSKGKETSHFAAELEVFLAGNIVTSR